MIRLRVLVVAAGVRATLLHLLGARRLGYVHRSAMAAGGGVIHQHPKKPDSNHLAVWTIR